MLQTVSRAIGVLRVLAEAAGGVTLTELARRMGSNKATVYRLVKTLGAFDLVSRSEPDGILHLGPAIFELAHKSTKRTDLHRLARLHLTRLRDETSETAGLHVAFGLERACIEQVESHAEIKWVAEIGKRFPLTAGAPGKVFIAFLPPTERDRILDAVPLRRFTSYSITDRREYERQLEGVRRNGYSISFNETILGAAACAAPVYDWTGQVIAALTVSGPDKRLSRARLRACAPLVRAAASSLSEELRLSAQSPRPAP